MIAVIFEVIPKIEGKSEYLKIAGELKETLLKMEGFISIERFQSMTNPNKVLSLSFWKDEKSVATWRENSSHTKAQKKGRNYLFNDYRLRITEVIRDYGMNNRDQAPKG